MIVQVDEPSCMDWFDNRQSQVNINVFERYSQGGRGNFTYLLEGQINFALKLSVGCLISQF